MIGERPESRSSGDSKNSFKISPRLDGADIEMMHYALGGDLNNIVAFDVPSLNEFAPSVPKKTRNNANTVTPKQKSALRLLGAEVSTPAGLKAPRLKDSIIPEWTPDSYTNIRA